jgi:hypothetical protein
MKKLTILTTILLGALFSYGQRDSSLINLKAESGFPMVFTNYTEFIVSAPKNSAFEENTVRYNLKDSTLQISGDTVFIIKFMCEMFSENLKKKHN